MCVFEWLQKCWCRINWDFLDPFESFNESVKPLSDKVTTATLDVYKTIASTMLPTPAKIHYLFNLRDISKIFQGMYRANKDFHDTPDLLQRLWVHECFRVFGDLFRFLFHAHRCRLFDAGTSQGRIFRFKSGQLNFCSHLLHF